MKTFKQILEGVIQPNGTDKIKVENLKDTCWKGYTAIGTKKKNGREVPNCVPEEVEVNEEKGNYSVTIHHTHPDGKKEKFNYSIKNANDATHAKRIALQKHGEKKLPTKMYGASTDDVKKLDEGKMAQLHADIEDHLGKHVANYKKMGGAEHLGNKTVEVAKKIAKLHNISHQAAQKHVNDYVDHNLKESDASWAASQEKKKEDRLTDKDKGTLGKIRDLMAKEKTKKAVKEETEQEKAAAELKLKLTKWKNQQRAAKALGEAVDKEHPIYKEYQALKKQPLKDLKDQIKRQHRVIDTSEFRSKEHAASHILHNKHGAHRMKAVFGESLENIDEAYRLPSDSEIDKVKAHVKTNHPNKSLAQVAVHKQSKKIEYVVKDKDGKMTGHTLGEEVEQIDEISKDTLHSYIHKAFAQGNDLHYDLAHSRGDKATDAERKALQAKISKRNTGIIKAGKKLREDVSMLSFEDFLKEQKACKKEELHPNQKKLDVNKNGKLDSDDFVKLRAGKKKEVDEKYVSDAQRKAVWASKNEKGVKEEFNLEDFSIEEIEEYMMSEDFEQLDEISKQVLGSYVKKASADIAKREVRIDRAMDASGSNYNEPSMQKALNKNVKRVAGLNKAADKLAKEEVELDEAMTPMQKLKDALDRHSEKAVAANKAGDHEAVKVHQSYMNKIKTKMGKLAKNEEIDLNEMEELCEISKQTLASYIPKAAQSARFSGMTAQHYANKSDRARNKGMQNAYHSLSMKYKNKAWDREANIKKAAQKLAKEETDVITFKELMQNISEAAIDDLKDRIAARKATQSAYDKDYKPAAKSNVQKVKGHSYGAGEEEGEDDDDTKKVSKPAAPEVKRGRGRPAGSKSGARR